MRKPLLIACSMLLLSSCASEHEWQQLEIVNRKINTTTVYDGTPGWNNPNNCAGMAHIKEILLNKEGISNGKYVILQLKDGRIHVVLVIDGWVLDNMKQHVYSVKEIQGKILFWFNKFPS